MVTAFFIYIEKIILSNLAKADSEVNIAVAWITNPKIFALLSKLKEKGVVIRILVADDRINFIVAKDDFQSLINKGIQLRVVNSPHLMHHKFCIIDNKLLITGSYNWTISAEVNNYENIILTNERILIDKFLDEFLNLSSKSIKLITIEQKDFKGYASPVIEQMEYKLVKEVDEQEEENLAYDVGNTINEGELPLEILSLIENAELLFLEGKYDMAIELCNRVLETKNDIADVYEIMASCKWRQNKFREQIEFAQKAVDLDNKFYDAYNLLGIGYTHIGNAQKAIENFQICINAESEQYVYYKNRARCYAELAEDILVPKKLRDQFAVKAKEDMKLVVGLTSKAEAVNNIYDLYYSRGIANFFLNQMSSARIDFQKAKEVYELTPRENRDSFDYKQIKNYIRTIEKQANNLV